ncbi:MAG: nucleotide exchange factor GrpE [Eubacteriales bacterium]
MKRSAKEDTEDIQGKKSGTAHKAAEGQGKDTSGTASSKAAGNLPEVEEQPKDESDAQAEKNANEAARAVDQELSDVKDRYMRILAEYDNFRRRTQKEREGLYTDAVADVTKEWLLVVDNVERALSFTEKTEDGNLDKLSEGMLMICKQAGEVLAKLGVEEIPCRIGSSFDPNLHSAVTHIEDDSLGEQCIAQVFLKGYKKGDRVIRHSLVQVAN